MNKYLFFPVLPLKKSSENTPENTSGNASGNTSGNTLFVLLLSLTLLACDKEKPKFVMPTATISVYKIKMESIGSHQAFVARTQASKEVDLRARVEGELIERHFIEGSLVKKNQLLLKIEPAEYAADLAAAEADLSSKKSAEINAATNLKRGKELISNNYITQADFDELTTTESQAKSAVKSAQAKAKQANLNLSYTTIAAPFAGQIGKVNYNVGSIVGPTSDVLASLTLTDPIYVNFQLDESKYIYHICKNIIIRKTRVKFLLTSLFAYLIIRHMLSRGKLIFLIQK